MSEERQTSTTAGRKTYLRAGVALAVFVGFIALVLHVDPADAYLWIKALHIIAVISWMAGLLYLPRLFIYHTDAPVGSVQSETFKVMEQRLIRLIMNPAMMITWVLGLYLAWSVYGFSGVWLHAKIALVIALTVTHVYFSRSAKAFGRDENRHPARHWRLMNEVPTVLMIVIVILVVVKPFG
ncbi:protoporphyrinogen oxidase HemJ [Agrobacterium cavarae]